MKHKKHNTIKTDGLKHISFDPKIYLLFMDNKGNFSRKNYILFMQHRSKSGVIKIEKRGGTKGK